MEPLVGPAPLPQLDRVGRLLSHIAVAPGGMATWTVIQDGMEEAAEGLPDPVTERMAKTDLLEALEAYSEADWVVAHTTQARRRVVGAAEAELDSLLAGQAKQLSPSVRPFGKHPLPQDLTRIKGARFVRARNFNSLTTALARAIVVRE
jgi:hypothetical protein